MTATPSAGTVGAIASFDLVVLDTPEPRALADFYCAPLGRRIVQGDDDWVTIRGDSAPGRPSSSPRPGRPDLVAPTWPDPAVLRQFHLDVNVPDLGHGIAEHGDPRRGPGAGGPAQGR